VTDPVVIDASAAVEISLNTARGRALSRLLPPRPVLWVPEHYFVEVGSALRRLEVVERRIDSGTAAEALRRANSLPARRVSVRPLVAESWSRRHSITMGDALYVVLAEHLRCPILTGDRRLAGAPGLKTPVLHISST
jgi:predicted nucleic acid-binding protein